MFYNNVIEKSGGGIYFDGSKHIYFDNNSFSSNTVLDKKGGAIFINDFEDVVMNYVIFTENISPEDGGGIYAYEGENIVFTNI